MEIQSYELDPSPTEYKREHTLGQGANAIVYRAKFYEEYVAVKLIKDDCIESGTREQAIMGRFHHKSLCRLQGYNFTKGVACLALEFAERGSLYSVLQNPTVYGELPWIRRLQVALKVATGLNILHSRGVFHRDLKSLNILLRKDWSAFIADFGAARIKITEDSLLTHCVGSIPWMAPEVMESKEENAYTSAVDIFSFGMVLYELLTQAVPYSLDGLKAPQIVLAITKGERPKIPDSIQGLPEGYLQLMMDCWAQEPSRRPDARAVITRLKAIIQGQMEDQPVAEVEEKYPTEEETTSIGQHWVPERRLEEIILNLLPSKILQIVLEYSLSVEGINLDLLPSKIIQIVLEYSLTCETSSPVLFALELSHIGIRNWFNHFGLAQELRAYETGELKQSELFSLIEVHGNNKELLRQHRITIIQLLEIKPPPRPPVVVVSSFSVAIQNLVVDVSHHVTRHRDALKLNLFFLILGVIAILTDPNAIQTVNPTNKMFASLHSIISLGCTIYGGYQALRYFTFSNMVSKILLLLILKFTCVILVSEYFILLFFAFEASWIVEFEVLLVTFGVSYLYLFVSYPCRKQKIIRESTKIVSNS